mmetsp:Transcript_24508/g.71874  ORF Transcript_24508/g.71874 Transcript_24508/m.71874 type:complete len:259 (-) Transcript_24508:307-1083(-)
MVQLQAIGNRLPAPDAQVVECEVQPGEAHRSDAQCGPNFLTSKRSKPVATQVQVGQKFVELKQPDNHHRRLSTEAHARKGKRVGRFGALELLDRDRGAVELNLSQRFVRFDHASEQRRSGAINRLARQVQRLGGLAHGEGVAGERVERVRRLLQQRMAEIHDRLLIQLIPADVQLGQYRHELRDRCKHRRQVAAQFPREVERASRHARGAQEPLPELFTHLAPHRDHVRPPHGELPRHRLGQCHSIFDGTGRKIFLKG